MAFDTSFFSDISQIASVVGTAVVAFLGAIWKFIISPTKAFRQETRNTLNKIEGRLASIEKGNDDIEKDNQEHFKDIEKSVERELADVREDHKKLVDDVNRHIDKSERKNEQMLDVIIRYFSEKKNQD